MKKQKKQQLALRKKAISNLDNFIVGGRGNSNDCTTQEPQTPTDISACRNTCPGNSPTRTCD